MKAAIATIALSAAVAAGWTGFTHYRSLSDQIGRIEDSQSRQPTLALETERAIDRVLANLDAVRGEVARQRAASTEGERELLGLLARLDGLHSSLATHADQLEALDARALGQEQLDRRLSELDTALESTRQGLEGQIVEAAVWAQTNARSIGALDGRLPTPRDSNRMWRELVAPVVQLAGDTSVGSGVLLASRRSEDGESFDTYLLTAWHVVRDIQGSLDRRDTPVPVAIYSEGGGVTHETASLLVHDPGIDVALLRLDVEHTIHDGATLAHPDRIEEVRTFKRIYAVGCPLGNDPVPTGGEVASARHLVDGDAYWMINAPTFIGNSGGGIFDAESNELLGLFSKIYNYGSMRPTIVPHMGLVMPLSSVYEWLDENGYGFLVPGHVAVAQESGTD